MFLPVSAYSAEAGANTPTGRPAWTSTWAAAAQQPASGLFHPNWSLRGFSDNSVRQVIRTSTGGSDTRIRLANIYTGKPLTVSAASIGEAATGAAVVPGSTREITFSGRRDVVIPPGRQVTSDPIGLPAAAMSRLAITLYFRRPTGPVDLHAESSATSYLASGDQRSDESGATFGETTMSWYLLAAVETRRAPGKPNGGIVAFGDSITDGVQSTVDADNRYPDQLAERLASSRTTRPVLNSGIGGNRVVRDSSCFGEKATSRLARDVLAHDGVRTAIVQEGINDIGHSEFPFPPCIMPGPPVTADQLIDRHRKIVGTLRANGIRVLGGTLLPYQGSFYYTEAGDRVRHEFNHWMRTSGAYDAVIDFDAALADPANRDRLDPRYDSGDRLHPNDAGYQAMADAIDLDLL
ncbi:SGNH/GDSL hydrolase family protein [Actinosynnema sp. ALI-1.44]|uniref:SGNH/GDSL hydrolase family protein n=1 Tax=Actinosynnema sp. ALI-1.44 TaxID=1933779 RepID=UPI00192D0E75|nr:SGNH/GDSL hydrolase family protein [Actinosynnema sp. ALI-1.44]